MSTTEPRIDERKELHTIGIRVQIPSRDLSKWVPKLLKELNTWMDKQGVTA